MPIAKLWPFPFLVLALYLAYAPSRPVGFYNDDARYILLARSMGQGAYRDPTALTVLPETRFFPGYPLFLSPWVKILQPRWDLLQYLSIALALISCLLVWFLSRACSSRMSRCVVTAGFALNPLLAQFSGAVMSDSLFLVLELFIFWALWKSVIGKSRAWPMVLSIALAWILITRQTAVPLLFSIAMALVLCKRWKPLRRWLVLPVLVLGLWYLRNILMSGEASAYFEYWRAETPYLLTHPLSVLDNINRVAYLTFVYAFLGIQLPHTPVGIAVSLVITAGVLFLAARGFQRLSRHPGVPPVWIQALALFGVSLFMVHSGWAALDARYALPLLPILFLGVVEGFSSRKTRAVFAVLLGLSYGWRHQTLLSAKTRAGQAPLPGHTFVWMTQHLTPEARVLTPALDTLQLYTGLKGVGGEAVRNLEGFKAALRRDHIAFALARPTRTLSVHGATRGYDQGKVFDANQEWLFSSPGDFKPVYVNAEEKAVVFAVRPD